MIGIYKIENIINKSKYLVKCPYCDKEGYVSLMKRYHFDKCKNKEQ